MPRAKTKEKKPKEPKIRKKRKPWAVALLIVLSAAVLVVGGVLAFAVYQGYGVYKVADDMHKPKGDDSIIKPHEEDETQKPPTWEGTERVNILLMGGDNRGLQKNESARSDSMMVASIDPVTKKAHLFSVLRDTYVDIEGHGRERINTAMALGGPNLAMKTIGDLLGLDIQYYVYTDFEGFKSLIDAIGGIDFDVEKDMNYVDNADQNRYDIHLKKGFQHLDGEHALMYVRFRHDAMSDFTRTERQRNFMSAVADKLKSGWNLLKMKSILESIGPYIYTNLEVSDMLKLAQLGLGVQLQGQAQVPPMDLIAGESVGGASVLAVRNENEVKQYVQDVLASSSTGSITESGDIGASSGSGSTSGDSSGSGSSVGSSSGGSSASSSSSGSAGNSGSETKYTSSSTSHNSSSPAGKGSSSSGRNAGSSGKSSSSSGKTSADPSSPRSTPAKTASPPASEDSDSPPVPVVTVSPPETATDSTYR